jgi:Sec-independent protein secretion pathway component TatC
MITQTLFAVPMILLYLLSILIARIVNPGEQEEKGREREE